MVLIRQGILLIFVCAVWCKQKTLLTTYPPISCPEYFEYDNTHSPYTGRITVRNITFGQLKLEIKFSQREPIESVREYGRLSFEHDLLTVQADLQAGNPIIYKVDFPIQHVLPKLVRLKVNDKEVCTAAEYPAPSTSFTLHRTFYPALGSEPQKSPTNTAQKQSPSTEITVFNKGIQSEECNLMYNTTVHSLTNGHIPWLAAIYHVLPYSLTFLGVGSLVSSSAVVTTAHLLTEFSSSTPRLVVILAQYMLNDAIIREVATVIPHADFKKNMDTDADIAILRLKMPVSLSRYVHPVCLWTDEARIQPNQTGYTPSLVNDGQTDIFVKSPRMLPTNVISQSDCALSLKHFNLTMNPRTFCANNRDTKGIGVCASDIGGGFVINWKGRWTLRGILQQPISSDSRGCSQNDNIVYCDIAKYITWMRQNI